MFILVINKSLGREVIIQIFAFSVSPSACSPLNMRVGILVLFLPKFSTCFDVFQKRLEFKFSVDKSRSRLS